MKNSNHRWLHQQLPKWEQEALLGPEAARILRERHPMESEGTGIAQLVMGLLGALLIGTGLIAVIAYNWDDFSRPVRLLFAFLPLLLTQIASLAVLRRGELVAAWIREAAAILQAFATGSSIAVVSQIYHLGGNWPDFLFWWMLLSLPLAWVLRSHAVACLYLAGIAVWSLGQVEGARVWYHGAALYPLLLLGLVPYWPGTNQTRPLPGPVRWFLVLSAGFGLSAGAAYALGSYRDLASGFLGGWYWLSNLTAAVILLVPISSASQAEPNSRKPQLVMGTLWLLSASLAMTFSSVSGELLKGMWHALSVPWTWVSLLVFGVFASLAVRSRRWAALAISSVALLPLGAVLLDGNHTAPSGLLLSWAYTLHLFALGTVLIGLEFIGKRGAPRLGAVLLATLIIARMADSHFSFLTKGLVFIGVGVGFLIFNSLTSRRSTAPQESPL